MVLLQSSIGGKRSVRPSVKRIALHSLLKCYFLVETVRCYSLCQINVCLNWSYASVSCHLKTGAGQSCKLDN